MREPEIPTALPENAYRELKPGEEYVPVVPPEARVPEVTLRSIAFGIAMTVVWAAAATYIALKVGQGIETAIPISILAVGFSGLLVKLGSRRSSLLENVNILAVGATSGMVAGGAVFTMPAIYLLGLEKELKLSQGFVFLHIFLPPFLGAILGVAFLVPFRRYFVKEMHGKLPFPEATATNQILVAGQGGGRGAFVLLYSFLVSAAYTIATTGLKLFSDVFTTGRLSMAWKEAASGGSGAELVEKSVSVPAFGGGIWADLADKVKAVFSLGTGAEFVGLGFIIGVRYAAIIAAGSILSSFVFIPLLAPLGLEALKAINPAIGDTSLRSISLEITRPIGIGCIFTAGILSILKMSGVIMTALREALGGLLRGRGAKPAAVRTDRDLGYPALAALGIAAAIAMAVYVRALVVPSVEGADVLTAVSVLLALGLSFVFITVSAWAIATISVTPISGMTVTTLIVTAVVLTGFGLPKGPTGQLAVLLVGAVVATALSVAGTLVTEFKIGYWLGATPKRIQGSTLLAAALASAVVAGTIMILAATRGFDPEKSPEALQAPQANMMRSALESFLGTGQVPWLLYGIGAVVAILVQMVGVSPLAFGLGIYLPMWLNMPILAGALVARAATGGKAGDPDVEARRDKGIVIASGLIAGAAIVGVIVSGLKSWKLAAPVFDAVDIPLLLVRAGRDPAAILRVGNWLGLAAFLLLCLFVYWDSRRGPTAPR